MSAEIERCILVKNEVFVYKIPPRASARGYRAADWNLSVPDWTGRLRVITGGKAAGGGRNCELRLEDRGSNELFAACPVESYPGLAVEAVTDSSRYFVICILDKESGRKAYIGMGFADRSDSFDLNVALQDHFKGIKRDIEIEKENDMTNSANGKAAEMGPKLNLAFKEGQTIRINIPKNEGATKDRSIKKGNLGPLPPPPGGIGKIAPPPSITSLTPLQSPSEPIASSVIGSSTATSQVPSVSSNIDLLGDLNLNSTNPIEAISTSVANSISSTGGNTTNLISPIDSGDPWGDFTSAPASNTTSSSGNWTTF